MTERLTTKQLMDNALKVHDLGRALEGSDSIFSTNQEIWELQCKVRVFEAVVWFPRLQAQVNGTDIRGMSGTCRDIKVMTWCCAGRCLIQLERGGHSVTLITADDEQPWRRDMAHVAPSMGPMGIQGINAEFLEALKMLYEATRYAEEIVLVPDEKVTIG